MTDLTRFNDSLLQINKKLRKLQQRKPIEFNIFNLLKVATVERTQSEFLAWLFDPRAPHRQEGLFLKAFLDEKHLKIPLKTGERYVVQTELQREESIIDIVIYKRSSFVMVLENKVYAEEQPSQVDREFRDMERLGEVLGVARENQIAIFLTPDGRKPHSGLAANWITASYPELAKCFLQVAKNSDDPKLNFVIEDWAESALNL